MILAIAIMVILIVGLQKTPRLLDAALLVVECGM